MPKLPNGREGAGGLAAELAPEEREALGDLGNLERRLAGYVAPAPSAADTQALLAHLRPLGAARGGAQAAGAGAPARPNLAASVAPTGLAPASPAAAPAHAGFRQWLSLAWSQTTVMEPAFWWACAAVFAVGAVLAAFDRGHALGLALALASPVVAAASVAYAFRPATRSLWELELAAPVRPLELLYARLGLVLTFNLLLSLALIAVLWVQEPRLVLWRVVLAWFGPMLGMAGTALYTTVRWGSVAGTATPMGLWSLGAWLAWQWPAASAGLAVMAEERLTNLVQSNALLGASLAALLLGLALLRAGGRLATGGRAWT